MSNKIKQQFAPLFRELGEDERFLLHCTDFQKLMYILIIFTAHMTNHQAPIDPRYYQHRYGIRARSHQCKNAIDTLLKQFPKLKCSNGKLSLLNSPTYESRVSELVPKNKKENKKENEKAPPEVSDPCKNPIFSRIKPNQWEHLFFLYDSLWVNARLESYVQRSNGNKFSYERLYDWLKEDNEKKTAPPRKVQDNYIPPTNACPPPPGWLENSLDVIGKNKTTEKKES